MELRTIKRIIEDNLNLRQTILDDEAFHVLLFQCVEKLSRILLEGNKVFFCGNGGSASDAAHLAAELSGKFYKDRKPLFAEALGTNISYLTGVSNDFGFHEIYSRAMEAKAQEGDGVVLMTTSGKSRNIINAAIKARDLNVFSIAMTGSSRPDWVDDCHIWLPVPSNKPPRIQEMHMLYGHIMCEGIEENLFPD